MISFHAGSVSLPYPFAEMIEKKRKKRAGGVKNPLDNPSIYKSSAKGRKRRTTF